MEAEAGPSRPFIGRREAVEALRRPLDDLRTGPAGVTLLVGTTGVGKSTLVAQLVEEIRARGIPVLIGRAAPLDAPPPFALLRSVIESLRSVATQGEPSSPFRADPVLIGFAPKVGEESPPDLFSIEQRLLEALGESGDRGERSREQGLARLAEQFREFTRRGPLVLVLEDLLRSDESSLAAVEFLVEELKHERFWLLATCRPPGSLSELGRSRLEQFERTTHARTVPLRPMTTGEVTDYLRLTEPSRTFSPEEVARRHSESGGNPLLLQQLEHGVTPGRPALGLATRELPTLAPDEQRALDVAAVLGPEFTFDTMLRVSGEQDEERFTEIVEGLVDRGLLFERSGEVLAFPEDRLREQAYGRLSDQRRQLLHWSAGETLEASGRAGVSSVFALARHFYLGHASHKSVKYNRLAAEIADRALAPEVARDHLLRAVESQREVKPASLEEESELVLELARITEELGRIPEAEKILREFLEREKNDPRLSSRRRAGLEIFLTRVLTDQGKLPAASEIAEKVLATPGLENQPILGVGAHHQLGITAYYEGRYAEALVHHTEELRLARQVGNELVILRAQIWRIAAMAMIGSTDEAVAEARAVTVQRDRLGSLRESAQAHLYFGDMLADARCTPAQRKEAVVEYARAIEFAEKAHDPRRVGWARYKTGELLRETQQFDEANQNLALACDIFREIGDNVGLSMAIKVQGQIAMDRGDYEHAEAYLLEAYGLLRGLHHTLEEIDVVLRLAQLACARGDAANARRHVAELERLRLATLRPDLVEELRQLQRSLGAPEEGGGAR